MKIFGKIESNPLASCFLKPVCGHFICVMLHFSKHTEVMTTTAFYLLDLFINVSCVGNVALCKEVGTIK